MNTQTLAAKTDHDIFQHLANDTFQAAGPGVTHFPSAYTQFLFESAVKDKKVARINLSQRLVNFSHQLQVKER